MIDNKTIAVVIPAYNEENQIGMVLESIPDFVDRIIVVNDGSKDKTAEKVIEYIEADKKASIKIGDKTRQVEWDKYKHADYILQKINQEENKYFAAAEIYNKDEENSRVILINLLKNSGVGAAVARGYKWCKNFEIDCIAKVDGDGQMDPSELLSICMPVINNEVEYVKGNRLIHGSAWLVIPKMRYLGNSVLSILTKIASGYWHVSDTQTAFSAISKKAINSIKLYDLYKTYGYPNDILVKLNIAFCRIREVEIKPIYYVGEKSKMKILKVIPRLSWLLLTLFFKRLWLKYLVRDFHPLFLLYNFSFLLGIIDIYYLYRVIYALITFSHLSFETLFAFTFLTISSFQSLLFAMWMDIQDNERLYK